MNKITIEKMPTATTANHYPIHKWFNFIAGYSPEYVGSVIDEFRDKNGRLPENIYDPFAGCATTNVVANAYGILSIGIERNPFFYKIGYAKTNAKLVMGEISFIFEEFIKRKKENNNLIKTLSIDAQTYLIKLFDLEILETLLVLRNLVNSYTDKKYYMGFIFLSKMLEFTTKAKTDGIYKVPSETKRYIDITEAIIKTSTVMCEGKAEIECIENKCEYIYDSSINYHIIDNSLDLVVFSPPYLNNFDFAEMTRMQLYFWEEAISWSDISNKCRNHMLVNTTTALKLVRSIEEQSRLRNTLPDSLLRIVDPIVEQLFELKKVKPSKKEYNLLIYPYLSQMRNVLLNAYNGLREKGEIHIVVSDAAFYGIHIDTQEYLKILLSEIGFTNIEVLLMRKRGERWILDKRKSSGKRLGEYEIIGIKE